jgi:hypothetical protein
VIGDTYPKPEPAIKGGLIFPWLPKDATITIKDAQGRSRQLDIDPGVVHRLEMGLGKILRDAENHAGKHPYVLLDYQGKPTPFLPCSVGMDPHTRQVLLTVAPVNASVVELQKNDFQELTPSWLAQNFDSFIQAAARAGGVDYSSTARFFAPQ